MEYRETDRGIERQCTHCKGWLTLDGFYRRGTSADGMDHACKRCRAGVNKTSTIRQRAARKSRGIAGNKPPRKLNAKSLEWFAGFAKKHLGA